MEHVKELKEIKSKCIGCNFQLLERHGFIMDENKNNWCPHCAFKLKKISAFTYCNKFTHWHGIHNYRYRPTINSDREIEFILEPKINKIENKCSIIGA